jgi:hypothetical protein
VSLSLVLSSLRVVFFPCCAPWSFLRAPGHPGAPSSRSLRLLCAAAVSSRNAMLDPAERARSSWVRSGDPCGLCSALSGRPPSSSSSPVVPSTAARHGRPQAPAALPLSPSSSLALLPACPAPSSMAAAPPRPSFSAARTRSPFSSLHLSPAAPSLCSSRPGRVELHLGSSSPSSTPNCCASCPISQSRFRRPRSA